MAKHKDSSQPLDAPPRVLTAPSYTYPERANARHLLDGSSVGAVLKK